MNFEGLFHHVSMGIDLATFVVENLAVATFLSADKEDDIVVQSKGTDIGNTVRYLPADGVEIAKAVCRSGFRHAAGDVVYDATKFLQRFGGLAVEADGAGKIERLRIVEILNDNGGAVRLPYQSDDFSMAVLAENYDLPFVCCIGIVFCLDASLEIEDDGASGINQFDIVRMGIGVGLRRFTMCSQKHFHVLQMLKILLINRLQTQRAQSFTFASVVHNIAKAEERPAVCELLFCLADSGGNAEAESRILIYFNVHAVGTDEAAIRSAAHA